MDVGSHVVVGLGRSIRGGISLEWFSFFCLRLSFAL